MTTNRSNGEGLACPPPRVRVARPVRPCDMAAMSPACWWPTDAARSGNPPSPTAGDRFLALSPTAPTAETGPQIRTACDAGVSE